MIDWRKIFFGINEKSNFIYIGEGHLTQDGLIKFHSKSGDKTDEAVMTVATMMRKRMEKKKEERGYFGYSLPMGQLILVKPGYVMEVRKRRDKEESDKPIYLRD